MKGLKKIRAGLYEIVGVFCGGDNIYGPCGGQIRTEKHSPHRGTGWDREFTWETHCRKCGKCDANGHPNLAEVLKNKEFWK